MLRAFQIVFQSCTITFIYYTVHFTLCRVFSLKCWLGIANFCTMMQTSEGQKKVRKPAEVFQLLLHVKKNMLIVKVCKMNMYMTSKLLTSIIYKNDTSTFSQKYISSTIKLGYCTILAMLRTLYISNSLHWHFSETYNILLTFRITNHFLEVLHLLF